MLSGDRIPPALPAALWRVKPDLRLMSLGGPTETTIWNISHPIDRPIPTRAGPVRQAEREQPRLHPDR